MVAGIGFRIGENFSGGVDDGGASASGLALLRGDFSERVCVVDFDAMGEEQSFLRQVALDFGAERGLPGATDHDVEDDRGGGNHDQENGEQFEEDAVLQFVTMRSAFCFGLLNSPTVKDTKSHESLSIRSCPEVTILDSRWEVRNFRLRLSSPNWSDHFGDSKR